MLRLLLRHEADETDEADESQRGRTENGQQDVDEEISSAAALEEDTDGGQDDGKKNLANVRGGERHVDCC